MYVCYNPEMNILERYLREWFGWIAVLVLTLSLKTKTYNQYETYLAYSSFGLFDLVLVDQLTNRDCSKLFPGRSIKLCNRVRLFSMSCEFKISMKKMMILEDYF